jgi:hypothetical protein
MGRLEAVPLHFSGFGCFTWIFPSVTHGELAGKLSSLSDLGESTSAVRNTARSAQLRCCHVITGSSYSVPFSASATATSSSLRIYWVAKVLLGEYVMTELPMDIKVRRLQYVERRMEESIFQ